MMTEFKEFLVKTNALALAIGVIIGVALGDVVSSLVNDIIMPPIGVLLGGVDFSSLVIELKKAAGETAAVNINWGNFVNTIITFVVIAFVVFMIGKMMIKEAPAAPSKTCSFCKQSNDVDASKCMHCTSAI